MNQVPVHIPTKQKRYLRGILRRPSGNGPFPVVLFVAGLGMTMHEWNNSHDEIARRLVDKGIMTIQFQFPIFDAKGRCRELPLKKRAAIVEDVMKWLRKRKDVRADRIGIFAQSYGVPTVLSADSLALKSYIFGSGAYYPNRSITRVYQERGVTINYNGDTSLPRSSGENTTVGKEFWQGLKGFDVIKKAKSLRTPVLLIHGDQDTKVTSEEVRKVFASIVAKQKKLKIFIGGDHGITDVPREIREEFLTDVVGWYLRTL